VCKGAVVAAEYEEVFILVSDIVGFTSFASSNAQMPERVVQVGVCNRRTVASATQRHAVASAGVRARSV
jgi:hypothetical protein